MKSISEFVKPEEILKWMTDLVSIPSYSGLANQEAEVGRYLKGVFDGEGIECRIAPLRDGRCNVYATLRGTGGGRLALAGVAAIDLADEEFRLHCGDEIGLRHGMRRFAHGNASAEAWHPPFGAADGDADAGGRAGCMGCGFGLDPGPGSVPAGDLSHQLLTVVSRCPNTPLVSCGRI